MKNIFEKLISKVLPFVLCICIVSGAAAPAYASTTNADSAAQKLFDLYWSTSSNPSGQNGTWYGVVRILLKDIYDRLESVWSDQRNLWTYNSSSYSLWNFSNNSNLSQSYYISNGAGPVSWLLNSMANLSQNTGYVANQFYNSNSNFNNALNAMVSLNTNFKDYTTILNNIKSNTDNLSGIKTDTVNLSGIKTDTANLSGIKTDTASIDSLANDISTKLTSYNTGSNFSGYYIQSWQTSNSLRNIITGNNPKPNYNTTNNALITYIRNGSNASIFYGTGVNPDTTFRHLAYQSSALSTLQQFLFLPGTYYNMYWGDNNGGMVERHALSIADYLTGISYQLAQALNPIQYMIADPDTLAAKRANANNENAVLTNFTGSGSASATPSDFGAVKDSIVDFKSGFSGGASSSDTFSFMSGDSNAWDWFTQDTANDLDRTQGSNTRLMRGSSDVAYDTPLLDSYYNSILPFLGGDD